MCAPEPLLERGEPLGLLAEEAARARNGSGRLVLLRGATGTGRTALLEAAAGHAAANGMRVLRARCSPERTSVPFDTVLQLFALGPEFDQVADEAPDPPDTPPDRGRSARLGRLLRSCAAESPLLVAVDDVHFADGPSRRWLAEAARRIDRLPVLLVVTERSQYDIDPPAVGLAHALSPALVHTRTLAPLSPDSAAEMVRSVHGAAPPEWVDACLRAGAGNPLLLRALLDDLRNAESGAFPAALPDTCAALYPGTYSAAVSWWLDSAGPATTEVARALAALDDEDAPVPADAELLARTAGADPARVPGWLTAMTGLGLLRPGPDGRPRYAHPLLRDAVLGGWASAGRQAAHRRAAEAMLHRGDHAEAVAGQLLRCGPVGEAWATGALLDAADLAVRADRDDDALAYLRRALDEPMPAARRTVVLTELGSLEYATVRSSAGIPRLAEALRLPAPPRERVHAAVALGTALARRGEARAAVDVLRGLRDEHLTGHPDLIRTVQTASALLADHDQAVRQEVYRWLRENAERSPQLVGTAGQALLVRYEATAGLTSAASAMHRIRALLAQPADPLSEVFLLGTAAAVAQWADQLDEAERLVRRGLTGQRTSLLHPMHLALLNVRIDIAAARGDHEEVLAEAEVSRAAGGRPESANALAHAVIALVETDRAAEATRLADAFDIQHAHDSWELNRFLYARGLLRAATGDPAAALDDFLECGRRQSARDVASPVVTPWRTAAARCHLALGRPHEALALAEQELSLATVWNTPRVLGRALSVLGTATGGRRGLELGHRAVRVLRQGVDGEPEEAAAEGGAPRGGSTAEDAVPDGALAAAEGAVPEETAAAQAGHRASGAGAERGRGQRVPGGEPVTGAGRRMPGLGPVAAEGGRVPGGESVPGMGGRVSGGGSVAVEGGRGPGGEPVTGTGGRMSGGGSAAVEGDRVSGGESVPAESGRVSGGESVPGMGGRVSEGESVTGAGAPMPGGGSMAAEDARVPGGGPVAAEGEPVSGGEPATAIDGGRAQGRTPARLTALQGWALGGGPVRTVGGWAAGGGSAPGIGGRAVAEAPDEARIVAVGGKPVETELIPALVAHGRGLAAAGDRARARDAFREAAERAERLGALRLRAVAEAALREGGARRTATALTGPGALTAGERRIAELAAQSRTNTEIAQLLHLARRTVETHLTSTYRKLGIRRRSELGAALANTGEEAG
ncbi:AAA family ATPase [Streptomyces sp. CA-210063]|uniref:AAA family ATPase n=1 Tax=Streptomyces sp. CA-210063 TaxID=2801029 RepID=UPI00214CF655|nr:AAA family ATPase [Streptomyces sp. CA-210063]UUU30751.1 AAA family ATPase [Streptomyces sp. CA-210063]